MCACVCMCVFCLNHRFRRHSCCHVRLPGETGSPPNKKTPGATKRTKSWGARKKKKERSIAINRCFRCVCQPLPSMIERGFSLFSFSLFFLVFPCLLRLTPPVQTLARVGKYHVTDLPTRTLQAKTWFAVGVSSLCFFVLSQPPISSRETFILSC